MNTNKKLNTEDNTDSASFSIKELQTAYNAVFRNSTDQPGFYFWDFGNQIESEMFRQHMIDLKNALSNLCDSQLNKQLNYQSVGRFNHQDTSKFHRDTANEHSFLMLGYEPTKVDSQVFLADYSKYIEVKNISLDIFFEGDRNSNLVTNNSVLDSYVTELHPFHKENYRLVLLNNSKSFDDTTFGVFHAAEIPRKIEGEDRIINYLMMQLCDDNIDEQYDSQTIMEFVRTNEIDR